MNKNEIDFPKVIKKFDKILERGLCGGLGTPNGKMCIEAAISIALGLPFNDSPKCVEPVIRTFKIAINDKNWSSSHARAKALRNIGIAQIGSYGVVSGVEFVKRLSEKIIRVLLPEMIRDLFPDDKNLQECADKCERDGTEEAAHELRSTAESAAESAKSAAKYAAESTIESAIESAAESAKYAAKYAAEYAIQYAAESAKYAAKYAAE